MGLVELLDLGVLFDFGHALMRFTRDSAVAL